MTDEYQFEIKGFGSTAADAMREAESRLPAPVNSPGVYARLQVADPVVLGGGLPSDDIFDALFLTRKPEYKVVIQYDLTAQKPSGDSETEDPAFARLSQDGIEYFAPHSLTKAQLWLAGQLTKVFQEYHRIQSENETAGKVKVEE